MQPFPPGVLKSVAFPRGLIVVVVFVVVVVVVVVVDLRKPW